MRGWTECGTLSSHLAERPCFHGMFSPVLIPSSVAGLGLGTGEITSSESRLCYSSQGNFLSSLTKAWASPIRTYRKDFPQTFSLRVFSFCSPWKSGFYHMRTFCHFWRKLPWKEQFGTVVCLSMKKRQGYKGVLVRM